VYPCRSITPLAKNLLPGYAFLNTPQRFNPRNEGESAVATWPSALFRPKLTRIQLTSWFNLFIKNHEEHEEPFGLHEGFLDNLFGYPRAQPVSKCEGPKARSICKPAFKVAHLAAGGIVFWMFCFLTE